MCPSLSGIIYMDTHNSMSISKKSIILHLYDCSLYYDLNEALVLKMVYISLTSSDDVDILDLKSLYTCDELTISYNAWTDTIQLIGMSNLTITSYYDQEHITFSSA